MPKNMGISLTLLSLSGVTTLFFVLFPAIANADSIIKTISFNNNPWGVGFDSINGKIYVSSVNPGFLSAIDGSTNTVVDNVSLGVPQAIAFNPTNNRLYITSPQGSSTDPVLIIDASTNRFLEAALVGKNPLGIAVDVHDNKIYVSNFHSDAVSVIDGSTDKVIKTIPVGHLPYGISFDSLNGYVYVANQGSGTVSIIDCSRDEVVHTTLIGDNVEPRGLDVNPFNGHVYVTNLSADTISEIDSQTNNVIKTIHVGSLFESQGPIAIAFNTLNNRTYVANYYTNEVVVIDPSFSKVIGSIPIGSGTESIAFDSKNGNIYTANFRSKTVSVISTISEPPPSQDTTPPTIRVPHSIIAEATSSSGAFVNYLQPTATDNVDGPITPTCNAPSDFVFPIGTTTVTCTATDKAGNTAKATFTVTVKDTTPPDTAIASAVDGSNRAITNDGSTLYHSIQIAFTGSDKVGIAGFLCSLDSQAVSSCTSPATFNNLAVGTHTFQVRGIDTSNNVDPTPASFTWTIVTPSQYTQQLARNLVNGITNGGSTGGSIAQFIQGIQQLVQFIQHTALPVNTAASLAAPLNQAILMLTDNNPNNDAAACNTMNGFAAQVNSYLVRGQISPTLAAHLTQQAQSIKTTSGCW